MENGPYDYGDDAFVRHLLDVLKDDRATQKRIDADDLLIKSLGGPVIDVPLMRKALAAGACPDRPVNGSPPLHIAVRQKSLSACFTLASYGASSTDCDANGNNALDEIALTGWHGVKKFLTGTETPRKIVAGGTATYQRRIDKVLDEIVFKGTLQQINAVLSLGAKPDAGVFAAVRSCDITKLDLLINAGADIKAVNTNDETAADMLWRMPAKKFFTKEWYETRDFLANMGCAISSGKKPEEMSLAELRRVVPAVSTKDTSLMHVLADAGKFDIVLDMLKRNPAERLSAEDFLRTGGPYDHALVTILAREKQLARIFTIDVWQGRVEDMTAVWGHVEKFYGARDQVDFAKAKKAVSDFRRGELGHLARKKNYKIGKN